MRCLIVCFWAFHLFLRLVGTATLKTPMLCAGSPDGGAGGLPHENPLMVHGSLNLYSFYYGTEDLALRIDHNTWEEEHPQVAESDMLPLRCSGAYDTVMSGRALLPSPLTRPFPRAMGLSGYVLLAAAAAAVAIRLHTRHPFPRVGNQTPFGIGYLITAFQGITKSAELVEEGLKKYPGKPFVLPTFAGSVLFTAHKGDVELMKKSDDSVVSPGLVHFSVPENAYPSF